MTPDKSRRVDPSEPAELIEDDEARHDERDKLLPDHFLDNADDRPFRRRNQPPIPTSWAAAFSMTTSTHGHAKRSVVPRLGASARQPTNEAVDRDAVVDAKNVPTAAWKTRRRVSHTAHRRPRTREKQEERPALARGKGIRQYSWHLPRGRFSNVPQWPHLNVR